MSTHYTIDLRARLIPTTHRCYILFPGSGYRYYNAMYDQERVFLDLPGFPLADGEELNDPKEVTRRVVLSERVREWHADGQPADQLPQRDPAKIKGYRNTVARDQFAGLVRGFFSSIKPGDIIIVPSQSDEEEVLFGEVLASTKRAFAKVPHFPGEPVPAIPVRWLKKIRRADIPQWLERKIPSPNPLRQIEREHFASIFDLVYERYLFDDTFVCKFKVGSAEFSSLDNFLFQQLVLYAAALHEAGLEDNINDIKNKSISVVVSEIGFSEDIPDQRIEINSPGHIVVYAKNLIPLVACALISLAGFAGASLGTETPKISVVNSGDSGQISDECVAEVAAEVLNDLKAMGYGRWQELCTIEHQARERTQLDPGMPVTPSNQTGSTKKQ